ncbi:hypothetical protein A2U01_0087091, partial [Trifolium medium]|nr:hypothetical protein [Trifolium medium]
NAVGTEGNANIGQGIGTQAEAVLGTEAEGIALELQAMQTLELMQVSHFLMDKKLLHKLEL